MTLLSLLVLVVCALAYAGVPLAEMILRGWITAVYVLVSLGMICLGAYAYWREHDLRN